MAEIPSNIAASAAQAGYQARQVAKERDANRASQVNSTDRQTKAVDDAGATVETGDNDAQISTNAEGSGSEGRSDDETTLSDDDVGDIKPQGGFTTDDDGRVHLDIEA